ncbi:MAG TPA: rhodanese-like domain-containing protein, partial [Saprospiraceae bacterium]|nr:rhodanese-like domain-containing protein [Saprospiraceae bacterium]
MGTRVSALISAQELELLYSQGASFVILDVSNHAMSRKNFETLHLKGAHFVDVNTQLSDIKQNLAEGGRHPLPTPTFFGQTLQSLGIYPESHVIVYDDNKGANAAARLWWMLKAQGHENVQVLEGGMDSPLLDVWKVNTATPDPSPSTYPVTDWQFPVVDMEKVEHMRKEKNSIVVDVRDAPRFRGEVEPIDLIAGHIPGAVNIPYYLNFTADGKFKSPAELNDMYQDSFGDIPADKIAIHCGSGVT